MKPTICNSRRKVKIPIEGNECEFWLVTVTDIHSIENPSKDHAYWTDDDELYIYDGTELKLASFKPVYTTEDDVDEFVPSYVTGGGGDDPQVYTNDYENLENKPSINGVTLLDDKTTEDLDIYETITNQDIDEMFA